MLLHKTSLFETFKMQLKVLEDKLFMFRASKKIKRKDKRK